MNLPRAGHWSASRAVYSQDIHTGYRVLQIQSLPHAFVDSAAHDRAAFVFVGARDAVGAIADSAFSVRADNPYPSRPHKKDLQPYLPKAITTRCA
jgi:hypothetical protein